jgi:hypothetical protein
MFEHQNSGKNRRKRIEIVFENLTKDVKGFDLGKKESKLSHACVPLIVSTQESKKYFHDS